MKKKILATAALVCALSTACIFGATACSAKDDGNGDNGGGEVTQAQWTAAFEKTLTARNLTTNFVYESETYDGMQYDYYYDFPNKTISAVVEAQFYVWTEGTKTYSYYKEEGYPYAKTESEYVDDSSLFAEVFGDVDMSRIWNELVFTKGQASGKISEMYASFEYDVNVKGYVMNGAVTGDSSEMTVTVKIAGGAVSYLSLKDAEGETQIYTYKNYGTTTVTVPDEVKNAPLASGDK